MQVRIITTFYYPGGYNFSFQEMYDYIKERGYILYPGKTTKAETFRVGNIGEIYQDDIDKVAGLLSDFLDSKRNLQAKGA